MTQLEYGGHITNRAARYRDTAVRCRHQASLTTAKPTAEMLFRMATENDRKADELEAQLIAQ